MAYIDVGKLLKELTTSPDGTKIPDVDCDNFPIKIDLRFLKRIILRQPIADVVEVKHGRYIQKGAWHIECSACGHILAHVGEAKNYCPHCGTKMDGDE